ncbi:hypothetical protein MIND_00642000 [Mycena indigotica]|uniref:F-box domain-containing protein n=1 Tax=Mycena indigotica TaxID=2126181 RepID=A0A8H6SUD7_9AGAR|nr:uncharacterized protein MIND_00642000 [Mycena indigotica]KAF7304105.1 hypothetical protein MIND_00642000 [Mycena indigotica]
MHLLDLPTEILQSCLLYLSPKDLVACIATGNQRLKKIIVFSIQITYQTQLDLAGLEEECEAPESTSTAQRIKQLAIRERGWMGLMPTKFTPILLNATQAGSVKIYELIADGVVIGDSLSANVNPPPAPQSTSTVTRLKYLSTTMGSEDPAEWRVLFTGKPLIDFVVADDENDLLVVITYIPHPNNPSQIAVGVELLQFSTGQRHPGAAVPSITICDVHEDCPVESRTQVVGGMIALWLYTDETSCAFMRLFDWHTGQQLIQPFVCGSIAGVFLTSSIVAIPNTDRNTLDVISLPELPSIQDSAAPCILPSNIVSFHLPPLKTGLGIIGGTFNATFQPFPCSPSPPTYRSIKRIKGKVEDYLGPPVQFHSLHEESLILFSYATGSDVLDDDEDDPLERLHGFVVRRTALLAILEINQPWLNSMHDTHGRRELAPALWLPYCTRFLDLELMPLEFMSCWGQRLVCVPRPPADAEEEWTGAPLTVLDFNRWNIRRVRKEAAPWSRPSSDNTSETSGHLNDTSSHPTGPGMIPIIGSADGAFELLTGATLRIVGRTTRGGVPASDQPPAISYNSFSAFTEPPVLSDLEYIEITSDEKRIFHQVHMNENNVLGVLFNEGSVEAILSTFTRAALKRESPQIEERAPDACRLHPLAFYPRLIIVHSCIRQCLDKSTCSIAVSLAVSVARSAVAARSPIAVYATSSIYVVPDTWCTRLRLGDTSAAEAAAAERDQEAALWQGDSPSPGGSVGQQPQRTPQMEMTDRGEGRRSVTAGAGPGPGRNIRDKAMIMGDD